jgi:hypothetical protein
MNDVVTQLLYLGGYVLLFVTVVIGIWIWRVKRSREKPPITFKLLRGPGESLRRRLAAFDEDVFFLLSGAALAPIVVGFAFGQVLVWVAPHMGLSYALIIIGVPMVITLFLAGRHVLQKLSRYRNDRLGYLGERAVGEALEPLFSAGFRVFHDIPAEDEGKKFNIDHVVVGPTGLFAIDTKTYRKGRVRSGYEAHKVAYDGTQLDWPWASNSYSLKNAEDRTRWLSKWLNKMTGLGLVVQPVLVLPGWYVVPKGIGPVVVVNHKQLTGAITRGGNRILSAEQIDLIARQLDELCRDIED